MKLKLVPAKFEAQCDEMRESLDTAIKQSEGNLDQSPEAKKILAQARAVRHELEWLSKGPVSYDLQRK
jgi:hypothetical protein